MPEEKVIFVTYNDAITQAKANALMGLITELITSGMTGLYLLFSSSGGEVVAGVTLYNFLKSLPIEVAIHNMGNIDSIATVVFLAGKKRYCCPHSTFLFHGVTTSLNGQLTLPQLNEISDRIKKDQEKISGIVCGETKIKKSKLKQLFKEGETQNSTFAVKYGIVEEARLPQIPKDASLITVNFNN